jgi:hypothetical protein
MLASAAFVLPLLALPPYRVAYSSRWPNNSGKSISGPCFSDYNLFAAAVMDFTGNHLPECNVTSPPLSCYTSVKAIKACLDGVPMGHRAVHLNSGIWLGAGAGFGGWAEADPGSQRGWALWADEWHSVVSERIGSWFAALKSIGGSVDVIVLDFEAPPSWLSTSFKYGAADTARVTADKRWPALKALLNDKGKAYGVSFEAEDLSTIGNWSQDPTDFRQWVWTDVMLARKGQLLNQTMIEPARESFPSVKAADYDHSHRPAPGPHWAYSYGGVTKPPLCCGSHVGTHSSRPYYGWEPIGHPEIVWSAPLGPPSNPTPELKVSAPTTPFNMLLHYVRQLRGQALSGVPQMPWVEPKNTSWYTTGTHRSVLALAGAYEELMLHMGLTGVIRWLWWEAGAEMPKGPTEGCALFSSLLRELDEVLGADDATPLSLLSTISFDDAFLLSGAVAASSGDRLWRFSPRDMGSMQIVSTDPATFQLSGSSKPLVPVAGARILETPTVSRASAGLWLVVNASVHA